MNDPLIITQNQEQSILTLTLKKYYVYALIDSRKQDEPDRGVFYIGKGTNKRIESHVKNAEKISKSYDTLEEQNEVGDSKEREKNVEDKKSKIKKINEIIESGGHVIERILGRFDTSEEAFAVEAMLIEWVYGRERLGGQLTNIQPGHGSKHIRRKGDYQINQWLDIPRKIRVEPKDNSIRYIDEQLNKLQNNNIFEVADNTVEQLRSMIERNEVLKNKLKIEDPAIVEAGRYVGATVDFGEDDVILRLQFTHKAVGTNLRARFESRKESRELFSARIKSLGLETLGPDKYTWLGNWSGNPLKFDNYEGLLSRIQLAFEFFKKNPK